MPNERIRNENPTSAGFGYRWKSSPSVPGKAEEEGVEIVGRGNTGPYHSVFLGRRTAALGKDVNGPAVSVIHLSAPNEVADLLLGVQPVVADLVET